MTFYPDQPPKSWKRHWQSRAQAHAVYFSLLLFKNNKVECLRAKHSLWAEIHLASSHFASFVPRWNNRKLEWQAAFYFQRSLESGSRIYWLRSCRMMEFKWIFRLIVTRLSLYTSVQWELIRKNLISNMETLYRAALSCWYYFYEPLVGSWRNSEKVNDARYAGDKDAIADNAKTSVPSGETTTRNVSNASCLVRANWILNWCSSNLPFAHLYSQPYGERETRHFVSMTK